MSDEDLVRRWQTRRDRAALDELRRETRALVQSQVSKYRSNAVPQSVIEAEADRILVASATSYKHNAGATFRTHLFTNLKRLNRFSAARSNIARIPEARAQKIGVYQRVYEELQARKLRPPTTTELADELNWPQSEILNMQRSLRRDIITTTVPMVMDTSDARRARVVDEIWYELTPDEQIVFAHVTGTHGRRKLAKGQDVARATGFSQAKVSQLRSAIGRKIEAHL